MAKRHKRKYVSVTRSKKNARRRLSLLLCLLLLLSVVLGALLISHYREKEPVTVEVTPLLRPTEEPTQLLPSLTPEPSLPTALKPGATATTGTGAPKITLNGDKAMTLNVNASYTESGATAKDANGKELKVSVTGEVNTAKAGTYPVAYSATDGKGRVGKAVRTVVVRDPSEEGKSIICLTFDDGPSLEVTPRILDTLKKNNMHATFFIINYSDDKKPLIRRMIDEGHTVGIHCYSHVYAEIYKSADAYMEYLRKLHDKIYSDFGYDARIIRFPGGSSNSTSTKYCEGIMTELVARVQEEGYIYVDWNVSSGDANKNNAPTDVLFDNTVKDLKKNRTNVVLMHDIKPKQTTADVLQRVIDYGKENGYVFEKITASTAPVHHRVMN